MTGGGGGYITPTLIKTTPAMGEHCRPARGLSSDANIYIHRLFLQMSRCGPIGPSLTVVSVDVLTATTGGQGFFV